MRLNEEELKRFDEDGYLFFPGKFTPEEAACLKDEAEAVYALDREEVWRESNGVARTAFAAHKYNEAFRRLGAHPRMIDPVTQVLDGPVYMHQYKVNAKAAFDGAVWQWHQDYGTWKRDDEMPELVDEDQQTDQHDSCTDVLDRLEWEQRQRSKGAQGWPPGDGPP